MALALAVVAFCLSLIAAAEGRENHGLKIFVYDLPQFRNATEWGDIRCVRSCPAARCSAKPPSRPLLLLPAWLHGALTHACGVHVLCTQ